MRAQCPQPVKARQFEKAMTSRDFVYWLQGFFEIGKPTTLSMEQTAMVKRHLEMVFIHEIDPSMGGPEKQAALNTAHAPQPVEKTSTGGALYRC
jgi:hypothetical protein